MVTNHGHLDRSRHLRDCSCSRTGPVPRYGILGAAIVVALGSSLRNAAMSVACGANWAAAVLGAGLAAVAWTRKRFTPDLASLRRTERRREIAPIRRAGGWLLVRPTPGHRLRLLRERYVRLSHLSAWKIIPKSTLRPAFRLLQPWTLPRRSAACASSTQQHVRPAWSLPARHYSRPEQQ